MAIGVQYCAKEMQRKFAEISEITRISAIILRTFASDEKAAKFRCFYCSNVGEISQARWLIETKFRARWTKFRVIRTKFRFDETKFRFGETKFRLSRICSWLQNNCNHHLMQKYRYMEAWSLLKKETSQRLLQLWRGFEAKRCFLTLDFFLLLSQHNFVLNVLLANRCISAISWKLSIACWYIDLDNREKARPRDKKQRRPISLRVRKTWKFYNGSEKMRNASGQQGENEHELQWKKVIRNTYDICSIKRVTMKFLGVSRCSRAKQRQRNVQKKKLCCTRQSCFFPN